MKLSIYPSLLLFFISIGCKDIRIDIREVESASYAILPKNKFWRKVIRKLLGKMGCNPSTWNSGYISFDLDIDDYLK